MAGAKFIRLFINVREGSAGVRGRLIWFMNCKIQATEEIVDLIVRNFASCILK